MIEEATSKKAQDHMVLWVTWRIPGEGGIIQRRNGRSSGTWRNPIWTRALVGWGLMIQEPKKWMVHGKLGDEEVQIHRRAQVNCLWAFWRLQYLKVSWHETLFLWGSGRLLWERHLGRKWIVSQLDAFIFKGTSTSSCQCCMPSLLRGVPICLDSLQTWAACCTNSHADAFKSRV